MEAMEDGDVEDWGKSGLGGQVAALELLLRCAMCKGFLDTPLGTPCGHTFCSPCIRGYLSACGLDAPCPTCRAKTTANQLSPNDGLREVCAAFRRLRDPLLGLVSRNGVSSPTATTAASFPAQAAAGGGEGGNSSGGGGGSGGKKATKGKGKALGVHRPPYHLLKDAQLHKHLQQVGLPTNGRREELIERHKTYVRLCEAENDKPERERRKPSALARAAVAQAEGKRRATSASEVAARRLDKVRARGLSGADAGFKATFQSMVEDLKRKAREAKGTAAASADNAAAADSESSAGGAAGSVGQRSSSAAKSGEEECDDDLDVATTSCYVDAESDCAEIRAMSAGDDSASAGISAREDSGAAAAAADCSGASSNGNVVDGESSDGVTRPAKRRRVELCSILGVRGVLMPLETPWKTVLPPGVMYLNSETGELRAATPPEEVVAAHLRTLSAEEGNSKALSQKNVVFVPTHSFAPLLSPVNSDNERPAASGYQTAGAGPPDSVDAEGDAAAGASFDAEHRDSNLRAGIAEAFSAGAAIVPTNSPPAEASRESARRTSSEGRASSRSAQAEPVEVVDISDDSPASSPHFPAGKSSSRTSSAGSGDGGSSSASFSRFWHCRVCTLENAALLTLCAACQSPKPPRAKARGSTSTGSSGCGFAAGNSRLKLKAGTPASQRA